jgi:hypothetical protein
VGYTQKTKQPGIIKMGWMGGKGVGITRESLLAYQFQMAHARVCVLRLLSGDYRFYYAY